MVTFSTYSLDKMVESGMVAYFKILRWNSQFITNLTRNKNNNNNNKTKVAVVKKTVQLSAVQMYKSSIFSTTYMYVLYIDDVLNLFICVINPFTLMALKNGLILNMNWYSLDQMFLYIFKLQLCFGIVKLCQLEYLPITNGRVKRNKKKRVKKWLKFITIWEHSKNYIRTETLNLNFIDI